MKKNQHRKKHFDSLFSEEKEEEKDYRIQLFKRHSPDDPIPGLLIINANCFDATGDMLSSALWLQEHIKKWQYFNYNQIRFSLHNVRCQKYGDLVHYIEVDERSYGFKGHACQPHEYSDFRDFVSSLIEERVTRRSHVPIKSNK